MAVALWVGPPPTCTIGTQQPAGERKTKARGSTDCLLVGDRGGQFKPCERGDSWCPWGAHAESDANAIGVVHNVTTCNIFGLYSVDRIVHKIQGGARPSIPSIDESTHMELCPLTKLHDWLFILDFASRYLVIRCGAPEGIDTGLMGVAIIAPLWGWVIAFFVAWGKQNHGATSFSRGFTLVTVVQLGLLFWFDRGPPTHGCGPTRAFPCPQTSIGAYVLYTEIWKDTTDQERDSPFWMPYFTTGILATSIVSVGTVGMADVPSMLAGIVTGISVGLFAIWPLSTDWPVYEYIRNHLNPSSI